MNENNNVQNNLNIQPTTMPKPINPETQVSPAPAAPQAPVSPTPAAPQAPVSPVPVAPQAPASPAPAAPQAPVSPVPAAPQAPARPAPAAPQAPASPAPAAPQAPVSPAPAAPQAPVSPVPAAPQAPASPAPKEETSEPTFKPITPNVDFTNEEFKTNEEIIEKNEIEKKEIKFVNPLNPETEIDIPKKDEKPEPVEKTNEEPINSNETEKKPEENNKDKKVQNKNLLIIIILAVVLLGLGVAAYFMFFKEDEKKPVEPPVNNDVTPPVVEEKVKAQTLTLKSSEDIKTKNELEEEKTNQRKNINEFSIDVNYALVDAGYSFNILNNVVTIKTNDGSYEYYLIQLDNKGYKNPIPLDLKQSYEDLIANIGNVIDINSDDQVVNFYNQHQIDQDAYFETLKLNKKLELINKAFNTEIDTLVKNETVCEYGDCSTVIYTNKAENPTEIITLITKAQSDDKEKVFFGTYLVYEKTNGTFKDVVSLTDDLFLNVTSEESE